MKTIFIVDDNAVNLLVAKDALERFYKVFPMNSVTRLFALSEKIVPDLILLDIMMPDIDGFEALSMIKRDAKLKNVPVIFLTATKDPQTEEAGFDLGAVDFITKPFSPPSLIKRIELHVNTDKLIKKSLAAVNKIHNATIKVLADMVESRDKITGGHIERTQAYLKILVKELIRLGAAPQNIDMSILIPSALLHDVGKIAISDVILNKPAKLSVVEYEDMQRHCEEGEKIIEKIMDDVDDNGFLKHALMFAGYHHEKWDGSGYPRGLKGDEIPFEGRIMAVCDVYDALVSQRPYKLPYSHERSVEIITEGRSSHFDPIVVDAFLNVQEDFRREAGI